MVERGRKGGKEGQQRSLQAHRGSCEEDDDKERGAPDATSRCGLRSKRIEISLDLRRSSEGEEEGDADALILSSLISLWLHRCWCFLLRKMVWNTWSSKGLSCSLSWYWKALQSKHISSLRSSPGFCLMRYILQGARERRACERGEWEGARAKGGRTG